MKINDNICNLAVKTLNLGHQTAWDKDPCEMDTDRVSPVPKGLPRESLKDINSAGRGVLSRAQESTRDSAEKRGWGRKGVRSHRAQ